MDVFFSITTVIFFITVLGVIISQVSILILKVKDYYENKDEHYRMMLINKEYFEKLEKGQKEMIEILKTINRKIQ